MIRLAWNTTRTPDLDGYNFYVEAGDVFDVVAFCEAYGLNRCDIDHNDIANAQAAASNLCQGEWLEVEYEADED